MNNDLTREGTYTFALFSDNDGRMVSPDHDFGVRTCKFPTMDGFRHYTDKLFSHICLRD